LVVSILSNFSKIFLRAETGIQNPILSASLNLLTVIAISSFLSLNIGHQLFPGFTAASVCM
jgi:hypothetical protein